MSHILYGPAYFIAYDEQRTIIHHGETPQGGKTETGLDHMDRYTDRDEWRTELMETFGINPDEGE